MVEESIYKTIFENSNEAIFIAQEGILVFGNPAFSKITGYEGNDTYSLRFSNTMHADDQKTVAEYHSKRMRGEPVPEHYQFRIIRKNGDIRWIEANTVTITWQNKPAALCFATDITERKKAEEYLELLKRTIDTATDAAYWMDTAGRFVYFNGAGYRALGYTREELSLLTVFDVNPGVTEERWRAVWEILREQKFFRNESTHRRKDGSSFPVEISSTYIKFGDREYVNGFARDISEQLKIATEKRQMEEHLHQSQKLEALGLLAGGIAHDFNNLLGGIFGFLDLAAETNRDATVAEYLTRSLATIDRARGLTRQLLTFAKGGSPRREAGNLEPFLRETADFALAGSAISCRFEIAEDLWPANFDRNQLAQVVDNLLINAQQAMPAGGTVTIAAGNKTLRDREIGALSAGDYAWVSFSDSGIGIPEDIIGRIFEPFFTTKQKGSGLGLAVCYSIINKHEGFIQAFSEPGKGTMFILYLPAIRSKANGIAGNQGKAFGGSGTILVVDDEAVVRDSMTLMLASMGFSVEGMDDGVKAVEKLKNALELGQRITAVILDLTIPGGMASPAVAAEIRKLDPLVPVFIATGYGEDPVIADPAHYGFTAGISKPFVKSDLAAMLRKHLEKS